MSEFDETVKTHSVSERVNYLRVCEEAARYYGDLKEHYSKLIDVMCSDMKSEEEINPYRELYWSNDKLANFYNSIRGVIIDSLVKDPEFAAYTTTVAKQNNISLVTSQTIQSEQNTSPRL